MGLVSIRMRLAAAAVAVILAGCGGDDGNPAKPGAARQKTIPKATFIARADELCVMSYEKARRLTVPPLPPRDREDLDEIEEFLSAQVALGSRELAQIRGLGVAVPGTAAQARNLDTADELIAEMRATAFHAGQRHLIRTGAHYRRVQSLNERATELAKRFGYHDCGQRGVHRTLNR
jgi:hypothetical protein